MRSAAQFFDAFGRAGMLTDAIWAGQVAVRGDFRAPYKDAIGVASSAPVFHVPVNTLPEAGQGDSLEIQGVRYTISAPPEPDGQGFVTLTLRKEP